MSKTVGYWIGFGCACVGMLLVLSVVGLVTLLSIEHLWGWVVGG